MAKKFSFDPPVSEPTRSLCPVSRLVASVLLAALVVLSQGACGKRPPPVGPPLDRTPSPQVGPPSRAGDIDHLEKPGLDLRIEPRVIRPGESALLSWESRNASEVSIEPAIGPVDLAGKIKCFPDETTTYTVTAKGPGGAASQSVTVDVRSSTAGSGDLSEEDLRPMSPEEGFSVYVKPVFFGFDSAELSEEALLVLDGNIRWLVQRENASIEFVLEGHADERGSEEYNFALADKRAAVVREYLVSRGISASRVTAVSLGEEQPFDRRQTEEGYALNRRAHFVLIKKD